MCVLTSAAADDTGVLASDAVHVTIGATVVHVTVAAVIAVTAVIAITACSVAIAAVGVAVTVATHYGVRGVGEYAWLPHRGRGGGGKPLWSAEEVSVGVRLRRTLLARHKRMRRVSAARERLERRFFAGK